MMPPRGTHTLYDDLLDRMVNASGVSRDVISSVLVRAMVVAPADVVRADIAKGEMLGRPSPLNAGAVSKAVAALVNEGLLTQDPPKADYEQRAGRPIKPLRLGSDKWGLMGMKVIHDKGRPIALTGIVTKLRMDLSDVLVWDEVELPKDASFANLAEHLNTFASKLLNRLAIVDRFTTRQILGLGVEIGGHVKDGHVIGATHVGLPANADSDLRTPLHDHLGVPVVIDNDVNVLAVRELYRHLYKERDIAVVAVFDDGVGASLILDGHVYRGGGGMAAEPGHLPVRGTMADADFDTHSVEAPRFKSPCHCGQDNHIDCYAVPARISAELGEGIIFEDAAMSEAFNEEEKLTRAGKVFRQGGRALGQGVASIINIVNPARVVMILPSALVPSDSNDGTAAAEYLSAVEETVTLESFSTGAKDARAGSHFLTIEPLNPEEVGFLGAHSAALRAFDAFIMHARGRDECHQLALTQNVSVA